MPDHRLSDRHTREQKLAHTFVDLADTLVETFDVHDFLQMLCARTEDVLDVDAVGVLVEADEGTLRLSSASTDDAAALDLFEMQAHEGPCYDAYRTCRQVVTQDLDQPHGQWAAFTPRAVDAGFHAVAAFPLRLRQDCVGAMNLFRRATGPFDDRDVSTAQALADLATIGLLTQRRLEKAEVRADQLQVALDGRVLIEQAKGVLAERAAISPTDAFERLRSHARNHSRPIRDVAHEVIDGQLPLA